jgi:hypothetical protein
MSKEAMTLALEALRNAVFDEHTADETLDAIKALEEALAKQEQGEPVACLHRLVDVTNPVVKSGYMCMDCGALFGAYLQKELKQEQGEPVKGLKFIHKADIDLAKKQEQEQGEPVAWLCRKDNGHFDVLTDQTCKKCFPVYTTPQPAQKPWIGLTLDERNELYEKYHDQHGLPKQGYPDGFDYERAIEAKLKEKNT